MPDTHIINLALSLALCNILFWTWLLQQRDAAHDTCKDGGPRSCCQWERRERWDRGGDLEAQIPAPFTAASHVRCQGNPTTRASPSEPHLPRACA
jgi:hypothetical protein